ncbi:MAG TPA: carbamoyl-phosphate synthase large subunit, partial [Solirubrobacterales bacterium]|nr:carbamoyl-phosphate synthase large subunit [Solirubrobacterales bacterium]
ASRERRMSDPVLLRRRLVTPNWERLFAVFAALRQGWTPEEVSEASHIDNWFLREIAEVVELEAELACWDLPSLPRPLLRRAKAFGLTDARIAGLVDCPEAELAAARRAQGLQRVYTRVDTCAAEFPATTPYLYSTFGSEDESEPDDRQKVVILGSGPNRIGQGIEFDYCCVHAAFALRELGYETVMINCNPETVSTDYDTSDRLYFEPLTLEHVMDVLDREKPIGVIVQLGGQTPLKLARGLAARGVPIWGTSPDAIDLAEDRRRFGDLLAEEGILQPENGSATSLAEARQVAERIGYPVVVRPSYVLGGRAMAIVYDESTLERYMAAAADVSSGHPILVDRFLEDAFEVDLDLISDGTRAVVAGILQHIEEAGIHSGDSVAVLPPYKVSPEDLDRMRDIARRLALRLGVVGLMNVQFALKDGAIYVLEVNPRASRTVPFIAKAVGLPLVKIAVAAMAGKSLGELGFTVEPRVPGVFVKAPVFPFRRFPGVDPVLGPEMKSTGEVMGESLTFGNAFAKAWMGAGHVLPLAGAAFLSVHDRDKPGLLPVAQRLAELGFELTATAGTADYLRGKGLAVRTVLKVHEARPHVVDLLINGEIALVVNTPLGRESHEDDGIIRRTALKYDIPCITTLSGAMACAEGIAALKREGLSVRSLQEMVAG